MKRNLARERDRLRLILEVNNHIIAHLEISDLFRAATKSIRAYFDNEFTGFWLYDDRSQQLELSTLDFGTGSGLHENLTTSALTREELSDICARVAVIFGPDGIANFPQPIAKALRDSAIVSVVCVPLVGNKGPLGIISLGSREADSFDQADLELLSQIASQISLAIENALAYRKVTFSCRRLEHEREYLESECQTEYNFEDIVGKSTAIKSVLEQVAIVAPTDSSVLLIGESGTGKELIARAIHNLTPGAIAHSSGLTVRQFRPGSWKASFLVTKRAPLPERLRRSEAGSNWLMRAACFLTKSETLASSFSPSCCVFCRSGNSKGLEVTRRSRSTRGWWRQRIAIFRAWCATGDFEKTFSTA